MFDSLDEGDEYWDPELGIPTKKLSPRRSRSMGHVRMQLADLNPIALLAAAVFSICFSGLIVLLIFAPRRNCFFLRWYPETRLLALDGGAVPADSCGRSSWCTG